MIHSKDVWRKLDTKIRAQLALIHHNIQNNKITLVLRSIDIDRHMTSIDFSP